MIPDNLQNNHADTKDKEKSGITVIVVENWPDDMSSNPGWGCLYFT